MAQTLTLDVGFEQRPWRCRLPLPSCFVGRVVHTLQFLPISPARAVWSFHATANRETENQIVRPTDPLTEQTS